MSHSETRLSVYLDNCELHVYNRTAVYSNLEKLFGIDELLPRPSESAPELVTTFSYDVPTFKLHLFHSCLMCIFYRQDLHISRPHDAVQMLLLLLLGRIAVLCTYVCPIVTNRVAWSVDWSVTLVSLQKWLNRSRCHFG